MAQLGIVELAAIYETAVQELNAMELRLFFLAEAARWRDLPLPEDLASAIQEHIAAAAALLKNVTSLPGRKRKRRGNMVTEMLS